ncbi:hypothetical protein BBJ28_00006869 [Nothophytophthora sp. Chile5]|nr:hypothetical protein BBJ28_00006869 [Nothophytophthora sp. Chile5]
MKFVAREKSEALKALESRVADARAEVAATGQSATQLDDLLESIRTVNDEALLGRQRSDYYKAILRHCELCPARDPNTIEMAEAVASKLRREIVDLQQKTQVISYEKRLVGLDVPKLVQVTQDKAAIHQEALTRLRWRQELDRRLYYASLSAKDSGEGSSCQHSTKGSSTSPGRGAKKSVSLSTSDLVMGLPGAQGPTNAVSTADDSTNTPAADVNFMRAKEKLLHMKETSLARQKNAESLQLYVGSAYKDDGVLGALRQVGINKPEEAMLYWQNQLDHSVQLEKEEKQAEQRVLEYREKVELLQAQFVNLKLSGSASARADVAPDVTAGASASADDEGAASSVGVNVKNLEQQLADATAARNKKKERAGRVRALQEKLQLGLLHVAQLLGVASVQQLNAVELIDAIEKVVRLELGDEAHVQAAANPSVRHKNSVRVVSVAGQLGESSALLSDVRSDEDKARYNIRVSRSERRQMNPYVEFEGEDDDEDDEQEEDGDEEQEDADGEHGGGDGGAEDQSCGEAAKRSGAASTRKDSNTVKKRRDIKNQSMLEIEKKRKAGQKKKSKE